jgi:hypothetical protein
LVGQALPLPPADRSTRIKSWHAHARDYGLFALDPFGRNAFDDKQEESVWQLPAGQKLVFLWRVAIHPGDAQTGHVADPYKEYAARR